MRQFLIERIFFFLKPEVRVLFETYILKALTDQRSSCLIKICGPKNKGKLQALVRATLVRPTCINLCHTTSKDPCPPLLSAHHQGALDLLCCLLLNSGFRDTTPDSIRTTFPSGILSPSVWWFWDPYIPQELRTCLPCLHQTRSAFEAIYRTTLPRLDGGQDFCTKSTIVCNWADGFVLVNM